MRVTLITGEFPPMRGGVADYTALLADGLVQRGVDVSVLTSIRASGAVQPSGVRVLPTVKDWGTGLWQIVGNHVRREKPDILHIQYQTGAFDMKIGVNLLPWLQRFRAERPRIVVTFHDLKVPYLLPKIGRLRHLATHLIAAGADAVVTTNPEDWARLSSGGRDCRTAPSYGRRGLHAVPIGSNVPARPAQEYNRTLYRDRIGAAEGDAVIAYFGFLGESKGLDTLVTAFEALVERGLSVRLLMVGASAGDSVSADRRYENRIRQRLDTPALRGRVVWTGFVHAADVSAYLQASDVCVLPFREGCSLRHGTLIAAIANHLPIVTTANSTVSAETHFPELKADENVVLVHPDDPEALSAAVERVILNPLLRARLTVGAARLAESFDWSTIANQTLRIYQAIESARRR